MAVWPVSVFLRMVARETAAAGIGSLGESNGGEDAELLAALDGKLARVEDVADDIDAIVAGDEDGVAGLDLGEPLDLGVVGRVDLDGLGVGGVGLVGDDDGGSRGGGGSAGGGEGAVEGVRAKEKIVAGKLDLAEDADALGGVVGDEDGDVRDPS